MIRLHGYDILGEITSRKNSRVYKVRRKPHEDVPQFMDDFEPCFAFKCISLSDSDVLPELKQRAVREVQTLLKLKHTNLAQYHSAFLHEGRICYMTDFAEMGTLHNLIYMLKDSRQELAEDLAWQIFMQICWGLKKLHSCSVIHRALKTRNILLQRETLFVHPQFKYRCKITDIVIPELQRNTRLSSLSGSTLRSLAPELLARQPVDEKVDIWALGCILYEMLTLSHAFNSTYAIQRCEYAQVPETAPKELASILPLLLNLDPRQRISVAELLELPVVRDKCVQIPNPALLDLENLEPERRPLKADGGVVICDEAGSDKEPVHSGPSFHAGMRAWAKYAGDGLWYIGQVVREVDDDAFIVQFIERGVEDLVFHDSLKPFAPAASSVWDGYAPHAPSSLSSGVILGFGKDDIDASDTDARRSVTWNDDLSQDGSHVGSATDTRPDSTMSTFRSPSKIAARRAGSGGELSYAQSFSSHMNNAGSRSASEWPASRLASFRGSCGASSNELGFGYRDGDHTMVNAGSRRHSANLSHREPSHREHREHRERHHKEGEEKPKVMGSERATVDAAIQMAGTPSPSPDLPTPLKESQGPQKNLRRQTPARKSASCVLL